MLAKAIREWWGRTAGALALRHVRPSHRGDVDFVSSRKFEYRGHGRLVEALRFIEVFLLGRHPLTSLQVRVRTVSG
jgi:hypothetical protein